MLPIGHIASALLVHRLARFDHDPQTAAAGALLPDAIDKTLAWVLKVVPAGRHIGHTPLATALLTLGVSAMFGRKRGVAFGVAYATHLVGDLWHGGHVPWLMPFKSYDVAGPPWQLDLSVRTVILEAISAVAVVALVRSPEDLDVAIEQPGDVS